MTLSDLEAYLACCNFTQRPFRLAAVAYTSLLTRDLFAIAFFFPPHCSPRAEALSPAA